MRNATSVNKSGLIIAICCFCLQYGHSSFLVRLPGAMNCQFASLHIVDCKHAGYFRTSDTCTTGDWRRIHVHRMLEVPKDHTQYNDVKSGCNCERKNFWVTLVEVGASYCQNVGSSYYLRGSSPRQTNCNCFQRRLYPTWIILQITLNTLHIH